MAPKHRLNVLPKFLPLFFSLLPFLFAGQAFSEEGLSAQEIVERMEVLMRGKTSQGSLVMEITTPNWQRRLTLKFWMSGKDKALVKILSPAKEAGIATLRLGSNMWNYLPRVERTVKMPLSMMMQPWMGSDFTNDDMMKATSFVDDYQHRLVNREKEGEKELWVVESVPKPGVAVVWGKIILKIGDDYLPRREEFYDEKGRVVKLLEFSDLQILGGRKFPTRWKMTTLNKKGCSTTLSYQKIEFDLPIPEETFSLQSLKR